jgi:hypothetical protein
MKLKEMRTDSTIYKADENPYRCSSGHASIAGQRERWNARCGRGIRAAASTRPSRHRRPISLTLTPPPEGSRSRPNGCWGHPKTPTDDARPLTDEQQGAFQRSGCRSAQGVRITSERKLDRMSRFRRNSKPIRRRVWRITRSAAAPMRQDPQNRRAAGVSKR